jgi:hypothetical protein
VEICSSGWPAVDTYSQKNERCKTIVGKARAIDAMEQRMKSKGDAMEQRMSGMPFY